MRTRRKEILIFELINGKYDNETERAKNIAS